MSTHESQLLRLHLAQAERALASASNNAYSDNHKQDYQNKLGKLFKKVQASVDAARFLSAEDIYTNYKRHIDFIFDSLEFLDSSTFNQIPFELVACLDYAMQDWLNQDDKYIIVTSLINDVDAFGFDPKLAKNDSLYEEININWGIPFIHRLVQINLPRTLARDYLASVVLYHELGHFIDEKYKFVESTLRDLLDRVIDKKKMSKKQLNALLPYFPKLDKYYDTKSPIATDSGIFKVYNGYLEEYFCDLFASQYIADSSNFYLLYITEQQDKFDHSHPSTIKRVKVVNDFLEGKPNPIVEMLNIAVQKVRGESLKKRYEEVCSDDFFQLIPVRIANVGQLHGLLNTGWKVWLNEQDRLKKALNDQYSNPLRLHSVVCNLIEKSIGNFITEKKWQIAKKNRVLT